MKPNYKPPFIRFVKKAHKPLQLAIEDVVEEICETPQIGEAKLGDLSGIRVHKFNRMEYLVAYRSPDPSTEGLPLELLVIDFYQIGSHENFYDELKRYLRTEG